MKDIKTRCLEFLHAQVEKGAIPNIRKGMVTDLESFIEGLRAEEQAQQMAKRMEAEAAAKSAGAKNDE